MGEKIHQLNDRTMKYITMAQTRRQHEYLGLPGDILHCILMKSFFQIWMLEEWIHTMQQLAIYW